MSYLIHLLIFCCIYIILSASLNIAAGYTGILSLGHAAFFGIGAYTSALLSVKLGLPFWVGLPSGAILAALFGYLLGIPVLKLRGDYLAIATLGFGEILRMLLRNWRSFTEGPMGIRNIPRPNIFGYTLESEWSYLILVVLITALIILIIRNIVHSPFGKTLIAIRENQTASEVMGKDTTKFKSQALTLAAFFAGIAGSLYAHYITFIDPQSFTLYESVLILCMVVLGGMGSLTGSVLGAVILVLLPEPFRFLGLPSTVDAPIRRIVYSFILIYLMIYHPKGLVNSRILTRRQARISNS